MSIAKAVMAGAVGSGAASVAAREWRLQAPWPHYAAIQNDDTGRFEGIKEELQ